jgi:signal transduction histidine kinase
MRSQTIKQQNGSATLTNELAITANQAEIERLAELGRLSASMLHEISSPLTSALLYLETYKDQPAAAIRKVGGSIKTLWQYVEAARQQVQSESSTSTFRVEPQITQLKRIVAPIAKQAGVKLTFDMHFKGKIYGDPVKFQQIVANLIVNAIESYGEVCADKLHKPVRLITSSYKENLIIEVHDLGQGIEAAGVGRIFEPFYTTKNTTGHGLGLGLSLVKQFVTQDFNGSITLKSTRRLGTVFVIKIPLG